MGDHRATITIKAEFHGKTYEWGPAWINYCGFEGVDRRVIEFFEEMWRDGYERWSYEMGLAENEQNKVKIEKSEREELARLKEKYGA